LQQREMDRMARERQERVHQLPTPDSIVRALTYGSDIQRPNRSRVKARDHSKPIVTSKVKKKRSMLTQARREALLEVFRAFDVDQGGTIDAEEFRGIGQAYSGRKWTNKEAREAMAKVDTDGGGEIEPDEFIEYFEGNVGFLTDKQFYARMNKMLMAAREARLAAQAEAGEEIPDPEGERKGGVFKLIEDMQDASDDVRCEAGRAVYSLARAQPLGRGHRPTSAITEAGGVAPLVELLQRTPAGGSINSDETRITAAAAIERLAKGHRKNQDAIRVAGGLPPLVLMLQSSENDEMQKAAACAAWRLVENNLGNAQALRLSEGVPDLVRLSSAEDKVTMKAAVGTLRCMGVLPTARRLKGADLWEGLRQNTC